MISRIINISSPARLSVKNQQLIIQREDKPDASVPAEDIGMLLVDNPMVSYSHRVLTLLAEARAALVLCGSNHMPVAISLPFEGQVLQGKWLRQQMTISAPLRKRLWQKIIQGKILRQADVLFLQTGDRAGLPALAGRVKSGDPENMEAQAAQRYWPKVLGSSFRRARGGLPPNNMLNYGYAVLRASIARALCTSGLHPAIGLHHHHQENNFPLADDVMEPYRPFVDMRVITIARENQEITREVKEEILSLFNESVEIEGRKMPIQLAIKRTTSSLQKAIADGNADLSLPQGVLQSAQSA